MNYTTTDRENQVWRQTLRAACAEVVREEADAFRKQDTSGVMFDRRYRARRRRTVRESRLALSHRTYTILSRVAIVVLVFLGVGGTTAVGVSAARRIEWHAVMDWQEDHVEVSFAPQNELTPAFSHTTPETNQAPQKIGKYVKPTYLPEGASERVLYQDETLFATEYYLDGHFLCGYQLKIFDDYMALNSEGAVITEIIVQGCVAYLFEYAELNTAQMIWTDGSYTYYLYGNVTREILMQMAESIC